MKREEEIKRGAKYNANGTTDDVLAEMYFIRGAEWADEHPRKGLWDSEKVIEWIKNNAGSYLEDNHKFGEGSEFCTTELLDDLRKAMEV